MEGKELTLAIVEKLKDGFKKFCECVMYVSIILFIVIGAIVIVYLLVTIETRCKTDDSRLARQLEVILQERRNNIDANQKELLINTLIKSYKPETDNLKVNFNPNEKSLPKLKEIIEVLKSKITGKDKEVLEKQNFKSDQKFSNNTKW